MLSNLKEEILQLKYDKKEIPENTKGLNLLERQKIIKKIKDKQEKLSQQEVIDVTDKEITDMLQTYKENMTKLLDIMKTLSIGDQEMRSFIKQSMLKKDMLNILRKNVKKQLTDESEKKEWYKF